MKNAILLHGRPPKAEYYDPDQPSASNAHWFPWLQKQLMIRGIKADTPEVLMSFQPQWGLWLKEATRFDITEETMLVGHSTGGGFWVRYLTEHPELKVDRVVLVAPWLNVKHEDEIDFFDFQFTPAILEQAKRFTIFSSDNDASEIQDTAVYLRDHLPAANFKDFHKYGHFCYEDMKTDAFPELLEELLK